MAQEAFYRRRRSPKVTVSSDGQHEYMVWTPKMHFEGFRRHLSSEEAYLVGIVTDPVQNGF